MELHLCNNNGESSTPDPSTNTKNGESFSQNDSLFSGDDFDSTCSTPYVSAPSSPGRAPINGGFFYSCPASPMHFAITATYSASAVSSPDRTVPMGYEFEFSARLGLAGAGQTGGAMSSADELFLNGQIRPMKLSSHLERPQVLAPLIDLDEEEEDEDDVTGGAKNGGRMRGRDLRLRDKSMRRRTRSLSPFRSNPFEFSGEDEEEQQESKQKPQSQICSGNEKIKVTGEEDEEEEEEAIAPSSASASSSRSSSAGRNSKRWVFLKDFLYRSKSEGRSNNKFWSNISFSPAKEKKSFSPAKEKRSLQKEKLTSSSSSSSTTAAAAATPENNNNNQKSKPNQQNPSKKPVNGVGKRRVPASLSPHELHYKASKAQAEEMRKKTFLPYRQGLLGCLGFSSKGYGAMNGFARALNPVSSR